jgi:hypothetical protein
MNIFVLRIIALCLLPLVFHLRAAPPTGFPAADEDLNYSVNWPSGLSLGEAHLHARKGADRWEFELTLEAAVPGFAVADRFHSVATAQFCSVEFEKDTAHGRRKGREKTTFDYKKSVAKRATVGGGKSEIAISACARDALAYLFYARRELGQGRVPPAESVLAGASYQVRIEYGGPQTITLADKRAEADRVVVSVKGPNSDIAFEAFFARDAARTPLLIRCPFSLGTFSLELVR